MKLRPKPKLDLPQDNDRLMNYTDQIPWIEDVLKHCNYNPKQVLELYPEISENKFLLHLLKCTWNRHKLDEREAEKEKWRRYWEIRNFVTEHVKTKKITSIPSAGKLMADILLECPDFNEDTNTLKSCIKYWQGFFKRGGVL